MEDMEAIAGAPARWRALGGFAAFRIEADTYQMSFLEAHATLIR